MDVLLAHGDEDARAALSESLSAAGARVVGVGRVNEALGLARQSSFHVLLSSLQLEDLDCWRLLRMVRSGSFCVGTLPVAILCADRNEAEHFEPIARDLQAEILHGPYDGESLLAEAQALCRRGRARVLVVEDDELAAGLAQKALGKIFDVEVAHDGRVGWAAWVRERHDLVLLDVMLPKLGGREVLERIRDADRTQAVVMITAYPTLEIRQELMLAGALDFLEKPIELGELRRVCDGVLRHSAIAATAWSADLPAKMRRVTYHMSVAQDYLHSGQPAKGLQHLEQGLWEARPEGLDDDAWEQLTRDE